MEPRFYPPVKSSLLECCLLEGWGLYRPCTPLTSTILRGILRTSKQLISCKDDDSGSYFIRATRCMQTRYT